MLTPGNSCIGLRAKKGHAGTNRKVARVEAAGKFTFRIWRRCRCSVNLYRKEGLRSLKPNSLNPPKGSLSDQRCLVYPTTLDAPGVV